ncbi:Octaprenyl-diphosphate synthase / Dimethylallyltransferase / Geranyltranstransferase (farnesyldiphosphate synthase) / Geranylgeranyl pyrophosphate synthetase [Lachnospiraceae bacterium TWA4]|nr:Octaprenyl-diphosphate synthase / Dimethylallyltransferase / Geranyltranstransferase (farnesyldiphosphate synthase) / Geranylgeranyl pyrophosphate synthetase [Lachnospiraceae bacterium TWA4]
MSFNDKLKQRTSEASKMIEEFLPVENGYQKTIFESMNYSVLAGGKRLRPILMRETYHLFGGTNEELLKPFMAAMELMHTASLVHDDLPCMDNDEYRRGKKTTWAVYGEDMATLAGDALMVYAFELMSKVCASSEELPRVLKAINIFANKSGIYGMIGGQTVDVELTNKPIDKDILKFIYQLKTGALLEASMVIGAVLAGASNKEQDLISQVALDVGMAFQIQDDILDVIGNEEVIGKPVHSDDKNNKTTYVTLYGIEKAKETVQILSNRAIDSLEQLDCTNTFLVELIKRLITREQ